MPKPRLLLIPTEFERTRLPSDFADRLPRDVQMEVIGFGPIAAAARTMRLLAERKPGSVLLIGIAGTYGGDLELGAAYQFREAACDGVGVGEADDYTSADELGWRHSTTADISDVITLEKPAPKLPTGDRLVSCCAASASPHEAARRRERHPGAAAEDMEGFAVALACQLAGVPCRIIRGVSNVAGVREQRHWKIEDALAAAADAACRVLSQSGKEKRARQESTR